MPTHTTNLHEHETKGAKNSVSYTLLMIYGRHPMSLATEACYHYTQMDIICRPHFSHWRAFYNLFITTITNLFVYTLGILGTTERDLLASQEWHCFGVIYACGSQVSIFIGVGILHSHISGEVFGPPDSHSTWLFMQQVKKILHGSIDGRTRKRKREASHGLPTKVATIWHFWSKWEKLKSERVALGCKNGWTDRMEGGEGKVVAL
ncbi:hypothetical protein BJ166DRAFT_214213 [Pestalotiopsis sp. NC0098]|nr:hypothetical protein BJ166DRAFT_214213 [Pestalotiopsis sp. NC0098]